MNLQKVIFVVVVFIAYLPVCFGQNTREYVEGENWVQQYGIYTTPYVVLRYDRYSKEDTVKFREKLDLLKTAKFTDEWEGSYVRDSEELGISSLRLDNNVGFIDFYFYSCSLELSYIDYGKIINTPDSIQLTSEIAENSPREIKTVKYVKVKWDKWQYLVEESSLAAFAEKAVGVFVEPNDDIPENNQQWSNYWVRKGSVNDANWNGDDYIEKKFTGLPEFPESYKKFQRVPIETKIVSVGKRTIEAEKQFGDATYTRYFQNSAIYSITIGAGKNKGIKAGMIFEMLETGEDVYITEVNQNTAVGFIPRETDDDKNDFCRDRDNIKEASCKKIKPLLKVRTKIGYFWF
jgi:hypothetical protein